MNKINMLLASSSKMSYTMHNISYNFLAIRLNVSSKSKTPIITNKCNGGKNKKNNDVNSNSNGNGNDIISKSI